MEKLPSVIPTAIIHIINTLESDSEHRYQWKLSRNLENVSLFVKCEFRAKSVEGDQLWCTERVKSQFQCDTIII